MMGISPLTCAVLLTAYAVAAGWRGPTALRRPWARRSPRLAMGLWLAAAVSWVLAAALAIVAVSVPHALTWSGPRSGGPGPASVHAMPGALVVMGLLAAASIVLVALLGWKLGRPDGTSSDDHFVFVPVTERPPVMHPVAILSQGALR